LQGTKLEPYARARTEAELRCALGDELYGKLITGELTAEEGARIAAEVKEAAEEAAEVTD